MQTTEREVLLGYMDSIKPVPRCHKCFGPLRKSGRWPFEGTNVIYSDDLFRDMEYMRTWYKAEYWECLACVMLISMDKINT